MAKLKDLKSDQLKQVSRYMDELSDGEEEVWRLFINGMSKRIYTESQIETFADENLKPRGSPSYSLLTDLSRRNMTLSEFLRIMKKIKCIKVINMFLQTSEFRPLGVFISELGIFYFMRVKFKSLP